MASDNHLKRNEAGLLARVSLIAIRWSLYMPALLRTVMISESVLVMVGWVTSK
jgi:hypothetical protein